MDETRHDPGTEEPLAGRGAYALLGTTIAGADAEEMPRVAFTRDRAIFFAVFVASAVAFMYFVLPKVAGLGETWDRLDRGDPAWLLVALGFELASFAGYVALFRTVFVRGETRIGWRESYLITMAGLAATRLFAAAGAGGIALTAWALRRSGMDRKLVACRMVAFTALLYTVYMLALVIDGLGLRTGVLEGGGSFAITVVPALLGAGAIAVFLLVSLVPEDVAARIERRAQRHGRGAPWMARAVSVPAMGASGVRTALAILRSRDPGALGALAWWGFDISVLWASFHAFGAPPAFSVIVMAYFVGMLANVLPLPGGIGGVEGGMIGALIAFGVNNGLAVVAVLVYRGFSFWLPTVPGAVAYLQLRRTVNRWRGESDSAPASAVYFTK
ncbi:MAG TPA: lysylphosphatidylglycerol synthase transmembrane domain-containing protein [Solirubrobacteraceae bacterium]|nr:lysylphosphatidylglycerol synthase transmembrane domain-containing protein [Solirubrobacteraceae bacterium]